MKILIISKEAWRDEQNGGNVLSNLFDGFQADFAQIYCNEREPDNHLCKRYFKITDRMMVRSIFGKGTAGRVLTYENSPHTKVEGQESFSGTKKWVGELARIGREMVWAMGKWDKEGIKSFVDSFNPDVVFAPCYGNVYMHKLTHLVCSYTKVPILSYISDDFYSNHQFRLSLLFWINHFFLRRSTRKVFKLYSIVYTMTDEQKSQCEKDFSANMRILRKCGIFDKRYEKDKVNDVIRMVYAGGIYLNRWKTLGKIADAIRVINKNGQRMRLDIYTSNPLTEKMSKKINDGVNSTVHDIVSMEDLMNIYHRSDIAIHAEGFDLKNRLIVRYSFSTKIVDCLDSGCAILAVCDQKQAGYAYLKRNDAALCISRIEDVEDELRRIADNPGILVEYQKKAFELGRKNHLKTNVQKMIKNDFEKSIWNRERKY